MNEFREKLLSIGFLKGGQTKPRVQYGRDAEGARTKATTDELGNTVTEHNNKMDQVDVRIKAPHIRVSSQEVRDA